MATLNLDKMFYPRSVAVVGASNRDGTPGHTVMRNLLRGGFEGPIMPVSAEDHAISEVLAYPRIEALPETPDLAVVCGSKVLEPTLRALGNRGTRAAILLNDITADAPARKALLAEAGRVGLQLLGPDTLGLMVPGIGLNASLARVPALPGGVAFVSQSSTVCAAVLDWAREHDIGFSHFVSIGDKLDVNLADILDYLGSDAMTRAILVYIENIRHGRQFLSAGRGASRNKPVLVIKAGRTAEGQHAALGLAEAAGTDEVYDAAIRRAGMLRVQGFSELFAAVETLGRARPLRGDRLAIISNGVGIAVMAVDNLILNGGRLAQLSEATLATIAAHVSPERPPTNPLLLAVDAAPEKYAAVAKAVFADRSADAILVMHAPTAAVSSSKVAAAMIAVAKEMRGTLLATFVGGSSVAEARHKISEAGIPTFDTVNQAVTAFMHMVRYRRGQDMLLQTPPSKPAEFDVAHDDMRGWVADLLRRGHTIVTGNEARTLLSAYGLRMCEPETVRTPEEAAATAERLGFPVSLKLAPREEATSVPEAELGVSVLNSGASVKAVAKRLIADAQEDASRDASLIVERIVRRPDVRELRISVTDDHVFGPVIAFGHGGPAADVIADRAVALPPLNMSLAREVIDRTRVHRLLQSYGNVPAADISAVCLALVQVSQMIIDIPEIAALDINPLLVDERGVFVKDVQILIAPANETSERRLAIRPYPKELEEVFPLASGRRVLLRPIRPEDEPAHHEFVGKCTPEDMRLRFFHLVRSLPHAEMARLTQIDYDREMAFIATAPGPDGDMETLGVVRTVADLNNDRAEYAILVRSDMKGQRLGRKLMEKIVDYCRLRGTRRIVGLVLRDNVPMLDLIEHLGFTARKVPDEDLMEVELQLQPDDEDSDLLAPAPTA